MQGTQLTTNALHPGRSTLLKRIYCFDNIYIYQSEVQSTVGLLATCTLLSFNCCVLQLKINRSLYNIDMSCDHSLRSDVYRLVCDVWFVCLWPVCASVQFTPSLTSLWHDQKWFTIFCRLILRILYSGSWLQSLANETLNT